jgi:hypothetical protein
MGAGLARQAEQTAALELPPPPNNASRGLPLYFQFQFHLHSPSQCSRALECQTNLRTDDERVRRRRKGKVKTKGASWIALTTGCTKYLGSLQSNKAARFVTARKGRSIVTRGDFSASPHKMKLNQL